MSDAQGVEDAMKTWPRTMVKGQWNGACFVCCSKAKAGELVTWDPKSGRPSRWAHVECNEAKEHHAG